MTVEEIFSQISKHMVEGLMFHSQMSDYYNFLGLDGFRKQHDYHFYSESNNFQKLSNYYIKHFNKFLLETPFENPNVIPSNWHAFIRQDVDNSIRKASIQSGIEKWVEWEQKTKKLYEECYKELVNLNEAAGAIELKKYITDVDFELAEAHSEHLKLKAMDYDISDIVMMQDDLFEKYSKKLWGIELDDRHK